MSKMQITRSIKINATPEQIYSKLSDFNNWQPWSPWLIMEPEASVKVSDNNKFYEWEGDRVGSGNMRIIDEKPNESILIDLAFLKPWKSTSKTHFEFKQNGEGTEVTWVMDGSWPFFLFWMKKQMEAYVGMDYERGLAMLKEYIEDGETHSKLEFKGISDFPGGQYIGITTDCTMHSLGPKMVEDFTTLWDFMKDHMDKVAGKGFSMYHKWDPVKNKVSYTSGIQVTEIPEGLPSNIKQGSIPATKIYTVGHIGPYKHLGNAWGTLYNMQRSKTFKVNKSIHPFEVYLNTPAEVAENELHTEVHFPIK